MPPKRRAGAKVKRVAKAAYSAAKKYVPKGTFATVGGAAGGAAGSFYQNKALGAAVGAAVGKQIAKLSGVGPYKVGKSLMPSRSQMPKINNSDDSITVSRSEYLFDLITGATDAFDINTFNINPGLDLADNNGCFSWLPQIAQAYQKYEIKQLVFEFRSTSGDSTGADTSLCQVSGGIQYVPSAGAFSSKAQLLDSQFAVSGKASENIFFPFECDNKLYPAGGAKNLRFGDLTAAQNIDNFDSGLFMIATQGSPTASQTIGEVYVHYKVKLYMHRSNDKGELVRTALYRWTGTASSNIVSSYPLGQGSSSAKIWTASSGSTMNLTFGYTAVANYQFIYLPPQLNSGNFLVVISYRNSADVAWTTPSIAFDNCEYCDFIFSPVSTTVAQTSAAWPLVLTTPANSRYDMVFSVKITNYSAAIKLNVTDGTLGSTITDANIVITQINSACIGGV